MPKGMMMGLCPQHLGFRLDAIYDGPVGQGEVQGLDA